MPETPMLARWWPWIVGLVGSGLALGPALGAGSLLNLDLVLTPHLQLPPGVWGLGPELPQRIPAGLPQAMLSPLVGAPMAGKAMIVLTFVLSFVGVVRLAGQAPVAARVGAGVLYALGPFALTRAAVGHLNVQLVLALLPFALPALLHPGDRLSRTYLWALALSLAGSPGGATAALVAGVGLVADRGRRVFAVAAVLLLSCLVWLAPSASVLAAGAGVSGAGRFATRMHGLGGLGAVVLGGGFWRGGDLGAHGPWVTVLAVAVVGLAVVGHKRLPERLRSRLLAVALLGLGLALASAVPGVRGPYQWFTDLPIGAPFRESQRSLCLWLVWLAPAAALGAGRLAEILTDRGIRSERSGWSGLGAATPVLSAVVLLGLAVPGWWGANGALRPVHFPAGWSPVAERVHARPGTVLALPWKEYLDLSFARGRRVLNPLPDYLGGDVLSSYDPEFDLSRSSQEQVDHRATRIDRLLPSMLAGRPVSRQLADLGVRWVVLMHESTVLLPNSPPLAAARATWERYRASLQSDAGLRRVELAGTIELWEVRSWNGPVRPVGGGSAPIHGPIPIVQHTSAGKGTWNRAGAPGWMRGATPASARDDGLLALPGGDGIVWFWPGILVLLADAVTMIAALAAVLLTDIHPGNPSGIGGFGYRLLGRSRSIRVYRNQEPRQGGFHQKGPA